MFVHLEVRNAADYFDRREQPCPRDLVNAKYGATYRLAHINQCLAMRDVFRAAGPSVEGGRADVFYEVRSMDALQALLRDDPYVIGGVWQEYRPRVFSSFAEPAGKVDVCLDGLRRVTAIEGKVVATDEVARALNRLRDDGELAVGGVREGDQLLAWLRTEDSGAAIETLRAAGIAVEGPTTRAMVWVL